MIELRETLWETGLLGKRSYKLVLSDDVSSDELEKFFSIEIPRGFVSCRIPASRIDLASILEKNNFCFVEPYLILEKNLNPIDVRRCVRVASSSDIPELREIAGKSFSVTRFHADPNIDNSIADKSRAEWVANALGDSNKDVYVFESENRIVSFMVFKKINSETGSIDLIATHPDFRSKGFGSGLLREVEQIVHKNGVKILEVGTQGSNTGSLNFYMREGFRVSRAYITFHLHKF